MCGKIKPKTKKNIKQFLGLVGYYRRFIPNFAKVSKPLTSLLKDGFTFQWTEEEQKAFESLRDLICSDPILQFPDFSKPFLVTTDASHYALGAVLSQGKVGHDLPICFASRILQKAELNYSTIEKELLAIIYAVKQFRPYIYGRKFTLVTDHRPLVWLYKLKDPNSRLGRWRIELLEYDCEIIYKPGKINCNADALSRNPPESQSKMLAPVMLAGGSASYSGYAYHVRLSSEQEAGFKIDQESDKDFNEMLERIFLDGILKVEKIEKPSEISNLWGFSRALIGNPVCRMWLQGLRSFGLRLIGKNKEQGNVQEGTPSSSGLEHVRYRPRSQSTFFGDDGPEVQTIGDIGMSLSTGMEESFDNHWRKRLCPKADEDRTRMEENPNDSLDEQLNPGARENANDKIDYRRIVQVESVPAFKNKKHCISYSTDKITMGKGNIAHFASSDALLESEINKELIDMQLFDVENLKSEQSSVGDVVVFSKKNRYVFTIIIKNEKD